MPDVGDRPPSPRRTWVPMTLWASSILLALGLAWFVGAVVVPVWRVRRCVTAYAQHGFPRGTSYGGAS
ncbi:MAG: hypothetical protein JW741_15320, partial [Sedimentisphaerales bacterium]|nr:hypothetical protein [Sedimentisphaerales bacterium]